ncbi:MAG: DUF1573 domain-containing protein [Bacteroidota bacterium]
MRIQHTLLSLALVMVMTAVFGQSQERKIKFEKTTHDFGQLEKGDPAEYTFTFTNTSDAPVTLSRVKASCGCTTPNWSREAIDPGATGEIKVKYNSYRVGKFTKSVTVTYDSVESPLLLYIKGNVAQGENAAENFTFSQGSTSFDKGSQAIGMLDSDKQKNVVFKVRNSGPQPIQFNGKYEHGPMMNVKVASPALNPGQVTTITVTVDGQKFDKGGNFEESILLYTNDAQGELKKLVISGTINKVYSEQELSAMPKIEFAQTNYDGGTIIEGETLDVTFKFTNTGGSDLIIQSVKASCGCTATAPKDKVVKPGQTSEITAAFNSRGRRGTQSKTVTVKTNDPMNPNVLLRLKTNVEQDPFHADDLGPAARPAVQR